jgi:uncharacterized repeat protein (TIGR02543 family)
MMLRHLGWVEAADLVVKGMSGAINAKTVTYDFDGGIISEARTSYFKGEALGILPTSTKDGFSLAGWTHQGETVNEGDIVLTDLNLLASWQERLYTITFETNGGGLIEPISLPYDALIVIVKDPERLYYNFSGWFTDVNLTTPASIPSTMPAQDMTLYAKWTLQEGVLIPLSTRLDLENIKDALSEKYIMVNDIDLEGGEWAPLGSDSLPFSGLLEGNGFTIKNITISATQSYAGLFANNSGTIKNLKLENVQINVSGTISSFIYASHIFSCLRGVINLSKYLKSL